MLAYWWALCTIVGCWVLASCGAAALWIGTRSTVEYWNDRQERQHRQQYARAMRARAVPRINPDDVRAA